MQSVKHSSCNHVFGPPLNHDQDKTPCGSLDVQMASFCNSPSVNSFWKPDADELALLNAGHPVVLHIIGHGMPPVAVGVSMVKE